MLLVDTHEPDEIFNYLSQTIPEVKRSSLNGEGKNFADYLWTNRDREFEQVERKHWTEIIPDIDKVEKQLDTQRTNAKVHYLLVEDLLVPTGQGVTSYTNIQERTRKSGGIYLSSKRAWSLRKQPQAYYRLVSWLYQLSKSGLEIWQSPNRVATATIITTLYHRSQKAEEENWAFQNYYRIKAPKSERDPHVISLIGLSGARLGPARARALIDSFGTLVGAVNASESNLIQVLGVAAAKTFMGAIGR
ncbi:hypothetical protein LCGC14_2029650 [marine sediment metagenome]|uniref:ERCC4 domain-containing protein n=1 Tax=marine sediment metagenome TaxID=412755 RepID=A0A0F9FHL9_9ZZZZ